MLVSLSVRPAGAAAPQPVDRVALIEGVGIAGDRHADPSSPRQLLLASASVYADLALPALALRENLLLDDDVAALPSGTVLRIGDQALVRLMFACEACGQLDRHGAGLAKRIGARRGVLARVVTGGVVCAGDAVEPLGQRFPAWSDDWRARIVQVLDAAPSDTVIGYADLARMAGIQTSYCRAFPSLLRKLGPRYAARAIAARAVSPLPRWHGPGLFE